MLPQNKPDRIRILFDDHRLVANAGLLLPATLARPAPAGHAITCPGPAPRSLSEDSFLETKTATQ